MRWTRRRLEVLVRAHRGGHLSQMLVLRLLRMRVHHVTALTELLQIFLQAQLRIGQMLLLLLLRGWCLGVVGIWALRSAHLRVWFRVRRRHFGRVAIVIEAGAGVGDFSESCI
jgi:hypothetical protein